jgi:DNA-binding transcriptional ArsR family regulator
MKKEEDIITEEYQAIICKAIVNPLRQKILTEIGNEKKNVGEISEALSISMSNLSNHLNALYNVGVINREKKGKYIYYYLMDIELLETLIKIKAIISRMIEKRVKTKH